MRTDHWSLALFPIHPLPGCSPPYIVDHLWHRVSNNCMFINYSQCNYLFIAFCPPFVEATPNLEMSHFIKL